MTNYLRILALIVNLVSLSLYAQDFENDSTLSHNQLDYKSTFFRDVILNNSHVNFLDNYSDYVVVQNEVIGNFHSPDRQLISIQGNSYRWTKHQLDGHRIDSRLLAGSALYSPNMYNFDFSMDLHQGELLFTKRKQIGNNVMVRYNRGDQGGISQWTQQFIQHATAAERQHKDIDYRKHLIGQGNLLMDYTLKHKGEELQQHLSIDFGERQLTDVDYTGYGSPYNESYAKGELMGELPTRKNGFFEQNKYAVSYTQRDHMNHEFYYNPNETAKSKNLNASLWGTHNNINTGINISVLNQKHHDKDFERNYVDMDGESLEPYYPDATYYELTHHLNHKKAITKNWRYEVKAYNSIIHSQSQNYSASNAIYYKSLVDPTTQEWLDESTPYYTSLYIKEWQANSFTSATLENSAQTTYQKQVSKTLRFEMTAGLSLDGLLLNDKSIVRPNWEFKSHLNWETDGFFQTSLSFGRQRIAFHYDMAKYLSNDYLQGKTYYWLDENKDQQFQSNERGDLLHSEGGAYRHQSSHLRQPAYWIVEWPMLFKINKRHRFSVYTTYKKYVNMWQVEMQNAPNSYGFYSETTDENSPNPYFYNSNQDIHYEINSDAPDALNLGQDRYFLRSTPFVFTNIVKYSYEGDHLFASASFTSHAMVGSNTAGNSVQENNLEFYSDLAANPNTFYKQASRPQQDRGYLAHLLLGYRQNGFRTSFLFKFIDGQPFAHYTTALNTDSKGQTQVAQWNRHHKGKVGFIDSWGTREDLVVNTEFKLAYLIATQNHTIDINLGIYNLFDVRTELNEACYALPASENRIPIEINIPRGFTISTKVSF